jgi:hypothetical protein
MNTDVLVPAALTFVREVDEGYPGRGTSSDGSLASAEHSANNPTSDHEHGTPQPGDRDVDAVDLDSDLVPGDKAASKAAMYGDVIPAFERHPGSQYWIHDDKICHRSEGWEPRSYAYVGPGRNRHTEHCHFNWQESAAAHNNTSPYGIKGVRMNTADKNEIKGLLRGLLLDDKDVTEALQARPWQYKGRGLQGALTTLDALGDSQLIAAAVNGLRERVEVAIARPTAVMALTPEDRAAIVAAVTAGVIAALPEYGPRVNTP